MSLIVQKFGGTSIRDLDRIQHVAMRIKSDCDVGHQVVIVVSARSGVTNRLIEDAKKIFANPAAREMDMLLAAGEQETIALTAMALQSIGVPAVSFTGSQAGILTDNEHTKARIVEINGDEIRRQLDSGKVVIVAGFQGYNKEGQITTLGRGGSDLTAIALAATLKADICRICTDVDGVYTADPRVVVDARKLDEIAYDEMLELASMGSRVMQSRAVEFAKNHNVEFEVCSSFNNNPGTIVKEVIVSMEDVVVRSIAVDKDQVKVVVSDLSDQPGTAAQVFQSLADADVNVDMIVQNVGRGGHANLTFTVPSLQADISEEAVSKVMKKLGCGQVAVAGPIAIISVVGVGMRSHSGVASKLFTALADASVNIQLISTSEIKISVAIQVEEADEACRAVHDSFGLGAEGAS